MSNDGPSTTDRHTHTEHHLMPGGVQYKYRFANGYGASVVRHIGSYGSAAGLWELAVLDDDGHLTYKTPVTGDVIGHLTWDNVMRTLDEIDALTPEGVHPVNTDDDRPTPKLDALMAEHIADYYIDNPDHLRLFWNGDGWSIDGGGKGDTYTEACASYDTFAEAVLGIPAFVEMLDRDGMSITKGGNNR